VPKHPNIFDFDFNHISGFHEDLGIPDETDASGGAGGDDVAYFKSHDLRNVRDQIGYLEDQIPGMGLLNRLPVEPQLDRQPLGLATRAFGNQVWPHRCERVKGLLSTPMPV